MPTTEGVQVNAPKQGGRPKSKPATLLLDIAAQWDVSATDIIAWLQSLEEFPGKTTKSKPRITPEQMVERTYQRFQSVYVTIELLLEGKLSGMVINGAPGIGKSYRVHEQLEAARKERAFEPRYLSGYSSPLEFYRVLHETREHKHILVLDDADTILQDETAVNLLKAAMDTKRDRRVSFLTATSSEFALPAEFVYHGRIIFISNLNWAKWLDSNNARQAMSAHMRALVSRIVHIDLRLSERDDVLAWVEDVCSKCDVLQDAGRVELNKRRVKEIVKWIRLCKDRLKDVSLRTVVNIAPYVEKTNDWRTVVEPIFCVEDE